MSESAKLEIKNVYKKFNVDGAELEVLKDINLEIEDGEFVSIVGHSGCGKSTLLKIIAGLTSYDSGSVKIDGNIIREPDVDRGMVFQEHRLLPWLTIENNIGFGLHHLDQKQRSEIVRKHIKLVKLDGFEKAYPHQLSGGMAQRAAIARALANSPEVLLLDEPFGALDALTRITLQHELLRIRNEQKTTMVLVTHDIDEAIFLGDRVVVMSARPGEIRNIFDIDLARPHDRGNKDFTYYKNEIYKQFFEEDHVEAEYAI